MLPLSPDMASLAVGSNNFPTWAYENSPVLIDRLASEMRKYEIKPEIEAFDLSHIHQAIMMNRDGRIAGHLYIQFVMGFKNAMPVGRYVFDYYIKTVECLAPDTQWCAVGIGQHQETMNEWAIAAAGHTRTELEDNIRLDRDTLAPSNAALDQRTVDLCVKYDRPVATWQNARRLLELPLSTD